MSDSALKKSIIPTVSRLEQSNRAQIRAEPVEMLILSVNLDVKSRYTENRRRPLILLMKPALQAPKRLKSLNIEIVTISTNCTVTPAYWEALHPYSAGGAYVNFLMDEGHERIKATYRDNYQRLVAVKNLYDPTNLFRVNQNIKPTV